MIQPSRPEVKKSGLLYMDYGNGRVVGPKSLKIHIWSIPWHARSMVQKTYPLKHLKKQIYWWLKQGRVLRDAHAVCFTTEEERLLGQKTFFPYQAKQIVTGLGVSTAPGERDDQIETLKKQFPQLEGKKCLLYLGRFHPKKGVDDLIRAWKNRSHKEQTILLLAGPLEERNPWILSLQNLAGEDSSILWTGMLEGDRKWGALRGWHWPP